MAVTFTWPPVTPTVALETAATFVEDARRGLVKWLIRRMCVAVLVDVDWPGVPVQACVKPSDGEVEPSK